MCVFGAFTGANVLRHDPPDRYVFNYRASYAEETDAVVRYLVNCGEYQSGADRRFRSAGHLRPIRDSPVSRRRCARSALVTPRLLRLNYKRNTVDVDDAVNQLKLQKPPDQGGGHGGNLSGPPQSLLKRRTTSFPNALHQRVIRGSTALADELMLLGPRYASGVIVTPSGAAVSGYSSAVLEYKNALAKYFSRRGGGLRVA